MDIKEIALRVVGDPTFWSFLLAFVFVIIGKIVEATKTEKDDKIWHAIMGIAHHAFNVAEKAIPDPQKPTTTVDKIDVALKDFTANYNRRFGEDPSPDILDFAKDEWAVLATLIKKK